MIVKKIIASDMNEAMKWIKMELGSEAVIISQRKVKSPGFTGMFKKKKLEVTAAIEDNRVKKKEEDNKLEDSLEDLKKIILKQQTAVNSDEARENIKPKEKINTSNNEASREGIINEIATQNQTETLAQEEKKENVLTYENNIKPNFRPIENNIQNKYTTIQKNDNKLLNELKETNEKKEIINNNLAENLFSEVREMKRLLNAVIRNNSYTDNSFLEKLRELDISEKYWNEMMEISSDLDDEEKEAILYEKINSEIDVYVKDLRGKIVLIGPTGVGKTTTVAKLAGLLKLKENKSVGLITVDIYRIGAVEQLKTYAEIMKIPLKIVLSTKEMELAIKEMKNLDVVLIDTTGRNSKNFMQISELRALVEKAKPDNIMLAMSSTTKNKDIKLILDGYSSLEYDSIVITKLDETISYGSIYTIAKESNKPISYITFGQNVPMDIKCPQKEKLVNLVLGKELM